MNARNRLSRWLMALVAALALLAPLAPLATPAAMASTTGDYLYVGDGVDNSIKRFDALTWGPS